MQSKNGEAAVQPADLPVASLEEYVRRRLGGRLRDFQLITASQGLELRGKVWTYHAKQLVQQAVMEVTKIQILANEIEVVDREQG